MAVNPTRAEIFTSWGNWLKAYDKVRVASGGSSSGLPAPDATNVLTLIDTATQSYEGDFMDEAGAVAATLSGGLASLIAPGTLQAIHRFHLKQMMKSVVGRTDLLSDDEMWDELFRYMHDEAVYCQSRVITFGTPTAAGGNVGTTQIVRLTKDRFNYDIESGYIDSKRMRCIADANTGTGIGQEVWELKGQASARDELERSGSGLRATMAGLTIDDSLLNNSGFRSIDTTNATITGWTSDVTINSTNYAANTTTTFREAPLDGTTQALDVKVSAVLTQKLTVSGNDLNRDIPYLLAVIWNRNGSTGTLTCRMGSVSNVVSVSGQSGWTVTLVPSSAGQSNWYRQFKEPDLDIQIEWVRTGGTIIYGEVLLVPGTPFDGTWKWSIPSSTAAYVPPRVDDEFTYPDIATGSARNQSLVHRAFPGIYLPHSNGSSITWTEA